MENQDSNKLSKANNRLYAAKKSIEEIKNTAIERHVYKTTIDAQWHTFLSNLDSAFEILKVSMLNGAPQLRQWYCSEIKSVAEKDPLLQYLHQARGRAFHVGETFLDTKFKPAEIQSSDKYRIKFYVEDIEGNKSVIDGEKSETITLGHPTIKLKNVTNRGKIYPVPQSHLSKTLDDLSIIEAAELAVDFCSKTIKEASERAWKLKKMNHLKKMNR